MSRFLPRMLRGTLIAASMGLAAATSGAAVLTLDGAGRLIGATGVSIAGVSYDVSFRDGTCAELFAGCDALSDFSFNTIAQARAASLALVDQVFNTSLATDADPTLTRGCEDAGYVYLGTRYAACWALTPFRFTTDGQVATHVALNDIRDFMDQAAAIDTQFVVGRSQTMAGIVDAARYSTFAVWSLAGSGSPSPASAPGSALLAGLALLLAGAGTGRRRAR